MGYTQQIYYNRSTFSLDNWPENHHYHVTYKNSMTFQVKIGVFQGLQTGKLFKTSKIFYTYIFSTLNKFQIHISLLLTDIHGTNKMSFT